MKTIAKIVAIVLLELGRSWIEAGFEVAGDVVAEFGALLAAMEDRRG